MVAALTMPSLISKYREKTFVEGLKQSYSIFSQAFLMAIQENGPAEYWDIGETGTMDGAVKFYDILVPFLNKAKSCVDEAGCFAENYKTLSGSDYSVSLSPNEHDKYAKGILANGVSFAIASGGSGCAGSAGPIYPRFCATLYVDLNAKKLPNQAGVDYFGFYITPDKILPMGLKGWDGGVNGYTCEYKGTGGGNGTGCTAWVLNMQNMNYLRQDISAQW